MNDTIKFIYRYAGSPFARYCTVFLKMHASTVQNRVQGRGYMATSPGRKLIGPLLLLTISKQIIG